MFQDALILTKAGFYTNASDPSLPIPLVLGDMTENTDAAAWVCPNLNTNVYAVAGWGLQTAANGNSITVYDDDGVVAGGEYTWTESGVYGGTGDTISYLTFSVAPTGTVTCKCKGKANSSGTLITNPLDCLEAILDYAEEHLTGFSYTQDATSWGNATLAASDNSYTCAGVVLSDNTPAYWCTNLLASFLGDWWLGNDGNLHVFLDTASLNTWNVVGHLNEREATAITGKQDKKNFCNQVQVNYALAFTDIDKRFKNNVGNSNYYRTDNGSGSADSTSQGKYGVRLHEMNFDWTRNTATVNAVQSRIVARFKDPVWLLDWKAQDFLNCHLEKGDFVTYNWEERKDENGLPVRNQIAQILSKNINMDAWNIGFTLRDTGVYRPAEPDFWNGTSTVGDGGTYGGDRDRRLY